MLATSIEYYNIVNGKFSLFRFTIDLRPSTIYNVISLLLLLLLLYNIMYPPRSVARHLYNTRHAEQSMR